MRKEQIVSLFRAKRRHLDIRFAGSRTNQITPNQAAQIEMRFAPRVATNKRKRVFEFDLRRDFFANFEVFDAEARANRYQNIACFCSKFALHRFNGASGDA